MIGNDIIDLKLAKIESNWKRKGFLDKIYTEREQKHILNSINPEIEVWNFWSRKEAAYKIYNRQTKIRAYIPLQLECFDIKKVDNLIYGIVKCKGFIFYTKTEINSNFILSIAALNFKDFKKIVSVFFKNNNLNLNNINIFKDKYNHPYGFNDITLKKQKISITHHGQYYNQISKN